MINKIRAFSLIELMVVIAIVALLAAVAVPSYKSYMIKAKITAIITPAIDALKPLIINYYNVNNTFPQASNLNLGSGYTLTTPTAYGSGIARIDIALQGATGGPGVCAALIIVVAGTTVGTTFTDSYGYISGGNDLVYRMAIYADSAGVIHSLCGADGGNSAIDNSYLPSGCTYGLAGYPSTSTASGGICN